MSNDNNEIIKVDEIKLTEDCRAVRYPVLEGEDLILYTSATGGQMYMNKKDISLMYHAWVEEEEINSIIDFERTIEIEILGTSRAAHDFQMYMNKEKITHITGFKLEVDARNIARMNINIMPPGFRDTIIGKISKVKIVKNPEKSEEIWQKRQKK